MSENSQSSEVTLSDFKGPFKQLIDMLSGKRAKFWFTAFKKFLRQENPFVPHVKEYVTEPTWVYMSWVIAWLKQVGLNLDAISKMVNSWDKTQKVYGIKTCISVLLKDLCPQERLSEITYSELLELASEQGFERCNIINGTIPLSSIAGKLKYSEQMYFTPAILPEYARPAYEEYCVMSEPYIESEGKVSLVTALIYIGDRSQWSDTDQGHVRFHDFELEGPIGLDPNTRLIFQLAD